MTEIQFALSLLVFILAWTFWVKVSLDHCRDNLFDLREERRDFFQVRDQLSNPVYANTRNLLNALIRYTEQISFVGLLIRVHRHPQKADPIRLDQLLTKADPETVRMVQALRKRAAASVLMYLIEINPILIGLSVFVALTQAIRHRFNGLDDWRRETAQRLMEPVVTPAELEIIANAHSAHRGLGLAA